MKLQDLIKLRIGEIHILPNESYMCEKNIEIS